MSRTATLTPRAASTSDAPAMLQRKCACGASVGLSGTCEDCGHKKMLGLQTKLAMGRTDDRLEHEADDVASRILAKSHATRDFGAMQVHAPTAQASTLRRLPAAPGPVSGSILASVNQTLSSSGQPLLSELRTDMESRFGVDFGDVRIHCDALAARSANDVFAQAYTAGRHIAFANGHFRPHTASGKHLLAHELTHVVQQATPGAPALMRKGFESTIKVCHRVLESQHFTVDKGGVRVVLMAQGADSSVPNCRDFEFGVTLKSPRKLWFDKEIGTCKNHSGGIRVFKFANLPRGTYYLTFWRLFDHPHCCLEGDVMVFDEAQASDGSGCQRAKDLSTFDIVHGALDLAGFIPVLGAIPDGINAGIYSLEGDWANAGLSAVASVPVWGDGIKLGTITGKAAIKVEAKVALKLGEEGLAAEIKALKAASESAKLAKREAAEQALKLEKEAAEQTARKKAGDTGKTSQGAKDPPKASKKDKPADKKKDKDKKVKKPKCTAAEIETYNLAMHIFCNKPRSCSMQGDSCESATAKVAAGYGCVDARVVLQQRCFHKGDPGYERHMQQIAQASAALRNCQDIMAAKCL